MPLASAAYPIWLNFAIFAVAAAVVWAAGTRLTKYADAISLATGLSHALVGILILATATSLPELATTVSASVIGNTTLVTHNLTGSVVTQMAILSAAGWVAPHRGALTYFSPQFVLLFGGIGLVTVIMVAVVGMVAGPLVSAYNVGIWPVLIFGAYVLMLYLTNRFQRRPTWRPIEQSLIREEEQELAEQAEVYVERPVAEVLLLFGVSALFVLAGGWILARAAGAIAVQTGLGASFIGATLLALATGLPELSTTVAAVRDGHYSLAIGNIFGTNAFNISLLFVGELAYRQGNIFRHVHRSAVFMAALGALMVCVYLWGMLERENRTLLGIGLDSIIVLALYMGGLGVLYVIR